MLCAIFFFILVLRYSMYSWGWVGVVNVCIIIQEEFWEESRGKIHIPSAGYPPVIRRISGVLEYIHQSYRSPADIQRTEYGMICLQGWLEICISTSDDIRGYHLHSPHPLFVDLKKRVYHSDIRAGRMIKFRPQYHHRHSINLLCRSPFIRASQQSVAAEGRRRMREEEDGGKVKKRVLSTTGNKTNTTSGGYQAADGFLYGRAVRCALILIG